MVYGLLGPTGQNAHLTAAPESGRDLEIAMDHISAGLTAQGLGMSSKRATHTNVQVIHTHHVVSSDKRLKYISKKTSYIKNLHIFHAVVFRDVKS